MTSYDDVDKLERMGHFEESPGKPVTQYLKFVKVGILEHHSVRQISGVQIAVLQSPSISFYLLPSTGEHEHATV